MDSLLQFLTQEELLEILEENQDIKSLSKEDIEEKIKYLQKLGCKVNDLLLGNPFYLTRELRDVENLITTLNERNIGSIALLIEAYPNILNKDSYEIIEYFKKKEQEGLTEDEIVNKIEENPSSLEDIDNE